jgi:tRNA nucleotidyltransferase (CCA-adding enzyme)
MQLYVVGGAVRDELLGRSVQDRDWVVVGATPEEMVARGFRPVGKDFPVFLHPQTHEEYALARTERKSGKGYKGFTFNTSPSVTLEEDLLRRDLTINAMARSTDGRLIDPYGGQADLAARRFRHVSAAFAEDPLRVLRVARFAARYADFSVADETRALMCELVRSGEIAHLVAERVWQELARGLMEQAPFRMLEVLQECGALAVLLPPLAELLRDEAAREALRRALQCTVTHELPLTARWACLLHALPGDTVAQVEALSSAVRAPRDCRDLAIMVAREWPTLPDDAGQLESLLALLERNDALRRPQRILDLLATLRCIYPAHRAATLQRVAKALDVIRHVDSGAVARTCTDPRDIPLHIRTARLAALGATEL